MWRFRWKKCPDFYCNVHSIRLLASALAYLTFTAQPQIIWQLFLNVPCNFIFLINDIILSTR